MAGQGRAGRDRGWVLGVISHSAVTWAHHRISGVGTVERMGKSERWMNGRSHTTPLSSLHFWSDITAGSLPSLSLWRRVGSFINPGLLPPHTMMQRFTQSRPPDQKIKDSTLSNNKAINSPLELQSEPGWSQLHPCQGLQEHWPYIIYTFSICKHQEVDRFQEERDAFAQMFGKKLGGNWNLNKGVKGPMCGLVASERACFFGLFFLMSQRVNFLWLSCRPLGKWASGSVQGQIISDLSPGPYTLPKFPHK